MARKGPHRPPNNATPSAAPAAPRPAAPGITRRQLFTRMALLGASGVLVGQTHENAKIAEKLRADEDKRRREGKPAPEPDISLFGAINNRFRKPEQIIGGTEQSYMTTAVIGAVNYLANILAGKVLAKLEIPGGNRGLAGGKLRKMLHEQPIATVLQGCIGAPITEEVLFRMIPSEYMAGNGGAGVSWTVGTLSSAVFALMHNLRQHPNGQVTFEKGIPLQQFMTGLVCWHLMRTRGIDHAIVGHGTQSVIVMVRALMAAKAGEAGSKPSAQPGAPMPPPPAPPKA